MIAEQAAIIILNLYVGSTEPKPVIYGQVLRIIQNALAEAERERRESLLTPSEN